MNELKLTDTNAADDSGGSVWGLEGNLFIPLVASAALSIGLLLLLFAAFQAPMAVSLGLGLAPLGSTLFYILAFKQGKPPGYDVDLFESYVNGPGFGMNPLSQAEFHPPKQDKYETSR